MGRDFMLWNRFNFFPLSCSASNHLDQDLSVTISVNLTIVFYPFNFHISCMNLGLFKYKWDVILCFGIVLTSSLPCSASNHLDQQV